MNKYGNIKCAGCGSENMKMSAGGDGLDELSAAGEGSGFGVEIRLECEDCGRVYPVCRVKDFRDVSDIVPYRENLVGMPTADVVPVRCKDCRFYVEYDEGNHYCEMLDCDTPGEDFYCREAVKKERDLMDGEDGKQKNDR